MKEQQSVDLLIKNGYIITMDAERNVFTKGFVAVQDGKIVATGTMEDCTYQGGEEIDAQDFVVMPGLINSHAHLVQACIKGMAEGTEFMERLLGFYFPMTGRCDEQRSYDNVRMTLLEMVKGGITATADDHFTNLHKDSVDGVIRAVQDSGMRVHLCRLINNNTDIMPDGYREEVKEGLKEVERLRKAYQSDFVHVGTGPIGIGYLANPVDELPEFKEYVDATGCTLDIHCPSSRDREQLAKRGWEGDSFEFLEEYGMLDEKVLLCHSTNIKPPQLALMAEKGVRVTLCPTQGYPMNLAPLLKAGVKVGLGLDGPVVSYHQNLWASIRGSLNNQRSSDMARSGLAVVGWGGPAKEIDTDPSLYRYPPRATMGVRQFGTPELALELGTLGSAQALAWDGEIGSLEAGKFADIILIDANHPSLNPRGRLVTLLVLAGTPDMVDTVIIGGKVIVRGGKHQLWDEEEVIARANESQAMLAKEANAEHFMPLRGSVWTYI